MGAGVKTGRMQVQMRRISIRTKDLLLPLPSFPFPSPFSFCPHQGTCESEGSAAAPGTVQLEEGRARALTTDRALYNLPTFVAPLQGCLKLSKCYGWQGG